MTETILHPVSLPRALSARRALLICALACSGAQAGAEDFNQWWLRIGPGNISFSEKVALYSAGARFEGADATVSNNTTLLAELGYRIDPDWSMGLTIGIPPKTKIAATGAASSLGQLGRVTYGPMGLTAQYRFDTGSPFRPYLGAGVAYNRIFDTGDGSIAELRAKSTFGAVLQAGFEYELTSTTGLFIDVKKLSLRTSANGVIPAAGYLPAYASVRLNPLVVQAGMVFRF